MGEGILNARLMTYGNGLDIHIVPYARREWVGGDYVEVCDGKTTACGEEVDTLYSGWRNVNSLDYGQMECRACHLAYYHGEES